ncbi:MAG: HAD family hydrolase [Candidatus Omnitrophota bacterium]
MIKCILFDFDGVIAESVDVKTEAFRALFECYPEYVDEIVDFHVKNGGMSRYDKFKYYYSTIIKEDLTKERFLSLCDQFSNLVVEKVISAPFVKGAKELIDKCSLKFDLFIVSGTPDKEIKKIVKGRGLGGYFKGVFGSPSTKAKLIGDILEDLKLNPCEAVFIGDAVNDLKAAKNTGVKFIARIIEDNALWAQDEITQGKFKSMEGVLEFIDEINADRIVNKK